MIPAEMTTVLAETLQAEMNSGGGDTTGGDDQRWRMTVTLTKAVEMTAELLSEAADRRLLMLQVHKDNDDS